MFRPKISIFVKFWVVSGFTPFTPHAEIVMPLMEHQQDNTNYTLLDKYLLITKHFKVAFDITCATVISNNEKQKPEYKN